MTRVRFPVRVRLTVAEDRTADLELAGLVLAAADAALGRAADHARRLSVVRDGSAGPPELSVTLTGAPLPAATAEGLITGLTRLVEAHAARLTSGPDAPPGSLPDREPGEPYDEDRAGDGLYRVPSYDGRGRPVGVDLKAHQAPVPPPPRIRLRAFRDAREMLLAVLGRYQGFPPYPLIVVHAVGGEPYGTLVTLESDGQPFARPLGAWQIYVPPKGGGQSVLRSARVVEADTLRYLDSAGTPAHRREIRRAELLRRLEALGEGSSDPERRTLAEEMLKTLPDPGGTTWYYELLAAGQTLLVVEFTGGQLPGDEFPVAVFTEQDAQDAEQERERACLPLNELPIDVPDPSRPFLGEPPALGWPPVHAGRLVTLINEVADAVRLPPGDFPGMFLLAAVHKIVIDARTLGPLTPELRRLRLARLAGAFDEMTTLMLYVADLTLHGSPPRPVAGNESAWVLHLLAEYQPRVERAIAVLFRAACQHILLERLEGSKKNIGDRLGNIPGYMKVTRPLIRIMLTDVAELTELRATLNAADPLNVAVTAAALSPALAWQGVTVALISALREPPEETTGPPVRGRIRQTANGPRVQAASGRWFSRAELDALIAGGREEAFKIDPLLAKLSDIPDVVARLRAAGPDGLDKEIEDLLTELAEENQKRTEQVAGDLDLAYGLATVGSAGDSHAETEEQARRVRELGGELSRVHAQADDLLRPLFTGRGEAVYTEGMRSLVASELGKQAIETFGNLVVLTAIAIYCPPLASGIGAVQALIGGHDAYQHWFLQKALLGSDDILAKADVEAEAWATAISAALVFLPEVKGLYGGARGGIKAAVRGEVRQAARAAGRNLARQAGKHLAELAAQNLLKAFATECTRGYLINLALEHAIGRFTAAAAHEARVTGRADILALPDLIASALRADADARVRKEAVDETP